MSVEVVQNGRGIENLVSVSQANKLVYSALRHKIRSYTAVKIHLGKLSLRGDLLIDSRQNTFSARVLNFCTKARLYIL